MNVKHYSLSPKQYVFGLLVIITVYNRIVLQ